MDPTRQLLTKGLKVTLNSDDPAYFFGHTDKYGTTHGSSQCGNQNIPSAPSTRLLDGVAVWSDSIATGGYVDSCYHATARECGLTADECVLLARNSLEATFAAPEDKATLVARLRAYCEAFSA